MSSGKKSGRKPPGTIDWNEVKAEYVTTDASYRTLAEKYGVATSHLGKRAKTEDWTGQRARYLEDTYTRSLEKARDKSVLRYERIQTVADRLLNLIDKAIKTMEESEDIDRQALKVFTGALKDIKDIQDCKATESEKQAIVVKFDNLPTDFRESK